jgi:hypothetical protein
MATRPVAAYAATEEYASKPPTVTATVTVTVASLRLVKWNIVPRSGKGGLRIILNKEPWATRT